MILREIKLLKKNPEIFLILMGAALGYAFLIGNLYSERILQNIPVAMFDLDESFLSRELVRNISEADQFILEKNLRDEVEVEKILERGEVSAVVVIPKNFSKNFYSREAVEVGIFFDGANIVPVNYSSTPISLIFGNFFEKFNTQMSIASGEEKILSSPINLSLRTIGNAVNGYLEFYIYGVMLMAAHVGITLAFGISLIEDKKNLSPSKIFAKEIFYLILSLLSVMVGIIFLSKVFEMEFVGEIWKIFLICGGFLFAGENLAGIFALIFREKLKFVQAMVFYTLPALLTAGYIFPEIAMSEPIKIFSKIQPVHYALADFRKISLTGLDEEFFVHFLILIGFGAVGMILIILQEKFFVRRNLGRVEKV